MLRWSVCFGVFIVLMATSSDVMAQRRQPLRNLTRQIGVRWGTGFHWANPGPNVNYYSPYSDINTPSNNYQGTSTPNSLSLLDMRHLRRWRGVYTHFKAVSVTVQAWPYWASRLRASSR